MFYRLSISDNLVERMNITWGDRSSPSGLEYVSYELQFTELQEQLYLKKEIPNCKAYKATFLPKWASPKDIILDIKKGECPDILPANGTIVSEKVRQIIEGFDEFNHQFLPVEVLDRNGGSVVKQPYYNMSVRRQIVVEGKISDLKKRRKGFYAYGNYCQNDFIQQLVFIEHQPEIRAFLESLPLWQLKGSSLDFYVNQELYNTLKSANVTGIESFGDDCVSEPTAAAI